VEREETLVFSVFPAAFLVNFETGPGHYQLEVVDSNLKAVKVIYDHVVTNEPSAWVEWDGKDSKKYDAPAGQYYVVYFKDGKAIKSLPIARTYKGP
jgi:flagellar hook assembly protein FlgD